MVTRSAPLLGVVVFVAESVGFRSPALPVAEGLEPVVLYKTGKYCSARREPHIERRLGAKGRKKKTYTGAAVADVVVVLDWVMANCCD